MDKIKSYKHYTFIAEIEEKYKLIELLEKVEMLEVERLKISIQSFNKIIKLKESIYYDTSIDNSMCNELLQKFKNLTNSKNN